MQPQIMPLTLKEKILKPVFDRYIRWRLGDIMHPEYPVVLDYPIHPEPRYGDGKPSHPQIGMILDRGEDAYRSALAGFRDQTSNLLQIAEGEGNNQSNRGEPCWNNMWFSGLDAIALYGLLASRKPAQYWEVGSGHSTMFARRAIRDLALPTHIKSIDPVPRAEIDILCDHVIRKPLENLPIEVFDELQAGDFLFIDSSHRTFQNSDVTVFFLEILPRLKSGVIVHIHDIFLPFDYPVSWKDRHYSEQYVLAAYLLGGFDRLKVLLPVAYVASKSHFRTQLDESWADPVFQRTFARYSQFTGGHLGTSFWLEVM